MSAKSRSFSGRKNKSKKRVTSKVASNFFANKFLIPLSGLLLLIFGFLGGSIYTNYSIKGNEFPEKALIKRVIDGDTIELDSKKAFRLNGMRRNTS